MGPGCGRVVVVSSLTWSVLHDSPLLHGRNRRGLPANAGGPPVVDAEVVAGVVAGVVPSPLPAAHPSWRSNSLALCADLASGVEGGDSDEGMYNSATKGEGRASDAGVSEQAPDSPLLVHTGSYATSSPNGGVSCSPKWLLQEVARACLPDEKSLRKCHRTPRASAVEVHRSASRASAAFRGLCTCQSVWQCPVCSARISATRAADLGEAIRLHVEGGGSVLLLTFTQRHSRDDQLLPSIDRQGQAFRRFWNRRDVKGVLDAWGCIGRVVGVEVTYGHASGWHPHRHVLLFIAGGVDPVHLAHVLHLAWWKSLQAVGLDCSLARGLDIRGGEAAGKYVVKLGLEVAMSAGKKGRGLEHFGAWDLLAAVEDGHTWAAGVFAEFAAVMKGRSHVRWSKGLRAALHLAAELTDAQIMDSEGEADEVLYARIIGETWRGICRAGIRGEVLQLLGLDDFEGAADLLDAWGVDAFGLQRAYDNGSISESHRGDE